jgi:hypothetical protein
VVCTSSCRPIPGIAVCVFCLGPGGLFEMVLANMSSFRPIPDIAVCVFCLRPGGLFEMMLVSTSRPIPDIAVCVFCLRPGGLFEMMLANMSTFRPIPDIVVFAKPRVRRPVLPVYWSNRSRNAPPAQLQRGPGACMSWMGPHCWCTHLD